MQHLLDAGHDHLRAQACELLGLPVQEVLPEGTIHALSKALEEVRTHVLQDAPSGAYLTGALANAAYTVGLAPRTLAAVLHELGPLPEGARVLDIGCGTGAASLACVLLGAREVVLVDHAASALMAAEKMLKKAGATKVDLQDGAFPGTVSLPASDVVVAAFSLLEAAQDDAAQAAQLAIKLTSRLRPGGALLLVDSAQKDRARILNGLRPALMERGFHIHAPCPHTGPCPALERERDFCHAARPWPLPRDFARVGELAGLHRHRLNYSFLLIRKEAPASRGALLRVIGDVQHEKGRARVAVCAPGSLRELVVLTRHKPAAKALDALERGALLPVPPVPAGERSVRVEDAALLETV